VNATPGRPSRLRRTRQGQSGLSLIEVIVVLMISSLILSAILPISLRAVSANHRLGANIINLSDRDIAEQVFRAFLASATPLSFAGDRGPSSLEGETQLIRISPRRGAAALCGEGAHDRIDLQIIEAGGSGRLICVAGNQRRTLYEWRSGQASFAFSPDGAAWEPAWPVASSGSASEAGARRVDLGPLRRKVVAAPLVRFEIVDARGGINIRWIARSGDIEPVVYDPAADIAWEGPAAFENLR